MKAPCKDCVMRMVGCHSWRLAYMEYAENREKERHERQKQKEGFDAYKRFKDSIFLKEQRRKMKKG